MESGLTMAFGGRFPDIADGVFVAPNAAIVGDVHIGAESSIWFGAVVRGDYGPVRIGSGCSIQDNAVVHVNHTEKGNVYPTEIADECVIGHGAVVEGCTIGRGCLIGMNAVVLPRSVLGEGCIVAAGSVVREGDQVPPYSLVAGAPAIVKKTFDEPAPGIAWAAAEYRSLAARYLSDREASE